MFNLNTSLSQINGIGPRFLSCLKKLDIFTVKDLLWHFPSRYEDFSHTKRIKEIRIGDITTISGRVAQIRNQRSFRKRMMITEARIRDASGEIRAVWFNQPYLVNAIKEGSFINLSGKVNFDKRGFYFSHPGYEILADGSGSADLDKITHTARIVPIYPETQGITSRAIRYFLKKIFSQVGQLSESLPKELLTRLHLPEINSAIFNIHFPRRLKDAEAAKKRFLFENFFYLQLVLLQNRRIVKSSRAPILKLRKEAIKKFVDSLPFKLTAGQKKATWQIIKDLEAGRPMNRLLEGDVGSGKTVVAFIAAFNVIKNDYQAVFMAPTEILANQHFLRSKEFFATSEIKIGLLTSSHSKIFFNNKEKKIPKKDLIVKIKKGEVDFIFGTHALLQEGVFFKKPGFVVVDEQHRFGVEQRAKLTGGCIDNDKKTPCLIPHFLSMTATPIPRTLALALYSDLDLSILEELPSGRKNIITKIIPPEERSSAYDFIRKEVLKGRQVFVICPRIELTTDPEGDASRPYGAGNQQLTTEEEIRKIKNKKAWQIKLLNTEVKNVKEEYEKLSTRIFPELKIAMLHGRLKAKEKEEIMKKFSAGETNILVSTSVVEVGIDVPNASVMMIEGAEHFGLSQLHQFRGRVGRSEYQSYCFVFSESSGQKTLSRLKALLTAKNGFELAQKDLEIRGPGQFLGTKQSGMPDMIMENLSNIKLIALSKEEAKKLLEKDPELKEYQLIKENLASFQSKIHQE